MPEDPFLKTHKIEGISEDLVPTALNLNILFEIIQVPDRESFLMA